MNFAKVNRYLATALSLGLCLSFSSQAVSAEHFPFKKRQWYQLRAAFSKAEEGLSIHKKPVHLGDSIVLETGEMIIFKNFLGAGANTIVIEDHNGRVFRLPKRSVFMNSTRRLKMFNGYEESFRLLGLHLPKKSIVHVMERPFDSIYAQEVEMLDIEETLLDYLSSDRLNHRNLKYTEALKFLQSLLGLENLTDLFPYQIGWVQGRGWVLFDINDGVRLSPNSNSHRQNLHIVTDQVGLWTYKHPKIRNEILDLVEDFEKTAAIPQMTPGSCRSFL